MNKPIQRHIQANENPIQANSGQVWGYSFIRSFRSPKKEVTKRYHHWAINGTMLLQRHSNVTESHAADSRTLCLPMRIHIYTYSYTVNPLYQAHTLSDRQADTLTACIYAQGSTSSQAQSDASAVKHPQPATYFCAAYLCYIPYL